MRNQDGFPKEIQLVRNRAFKITSKAVISELENRWSDSLLTLIAGSQRREIEFCGDYRVFLYRAKGSDTPWPILDQSWGTSGKLIDLAHGVSIGSEEGFRTLLGLENRGDGLDDLRREEALTLSAVLQGAISFHPDNPSTANCEKSTQLDSPSDQLVHYVLGRVIKSYEDLLAVSLPCERPDLDARIDLEEIEIPRNLVRDEPKEVEALADEIKAHGGLINPITVIWISRGRFRLVAGRRRFAAYKLLGWSSIPVRIIAGDEAHLVSTQIIENDARLDMDPFTRADAYVTLKRAIEAKSGACPNKLLAEALGVTPQRVSEVLKLLELPQEHRNRVRELGLGLRATVDMVRDFIKTGNLGNALETREEITALTGASEAKTSTRRSRRKILKFKLDGYEITLKSPNDEEPSNELWIEQLQALIKKLKAKGMS